MFADKLIMLRKQRGLSQEELADKLDVSRQAISKWEGNQSMPDLQKIVKISQLFNVSTDYLLMDNVNIISDVDTKAQINCIDIENKDLECQKIDEYQIKDYFEVIKYRAKSFVAGISVFVVPIFFIILCLIGIVLNSGDVAMAMVCKAVITLIVLVCGIIIMVNCSNQKNKYAYLKKPFELTKEAMDIVDQKKAKYLKFCQKCKIICLLLLVSTGVPILICAILDMSTRFKLDEFNVILLVLAIIFAIIWADIILLTLAVILTNSTKRLEKHTDNKPKKINMEIASLLINILWVVLIALFLVYNYNVSGDNSIIFLIIGALTLFIVFIILYVVNNVRKEKFRQ